MWADAGRSALSPIGGFDTKASRKFIIYYEIIMLSAYSERFCILRNLFSRKTFGKNRRLAIRI